MRWLAVLLVLLYGSSVAIKFNTVTETTWRAGVDCKETCTKELKPVCAVSRNEYLIFGNTCQMELYNCMNMENFLRVDMRMCIQSIKMEYDDEKKMFTVVNRSAEEVIAEFLPRGRSYFL